MSDIRHVVAVFAVVMGSLLLGTWVVLFLLGAVDYGESRVELVFLLVAEFGTGFTLVVCGASTAMHRRWGAPSVLIGLGMLAYCSVYSVGVFAARGNSAATAWFVLVSAGAVVCAVLLVLDITRDSRI